MLLKKLREERHWSQEQLATLAGISLRTVQRVEAGHNASLETLKSLAAVFEIDISKLTEVIPVIDKNSPEWKAEPWLIRALVHPLYKRSRYLRYEYFFFFFGVFALAVGASPFVTGLCLSVAYLMAKVMQYIDRKGYW